MAETLNFAAEQLESAGLKAGYHNHQLEFTPAADLPMKARPIEIIAKNTKPAIMLQFDVDGTCIEAGIKDPVAWIRANPGRIRSLHCKDWSPDPAKGYAVLFGEGVADWKNIFAAAEGTAPADHRSLDMDGAGGRGVDDALQRRDVVSRPGRRRADAEPAEHRWHQLAVGHPVALHQGQPLLGVEMLHHYGRGAEAQGPGDGGRRSCVVQRRYPEQVWIMTATRTFVPGARQTALQLWPPAAVAEHTARIRGAGTR